MADSSFKPSAVVSEGSLLKNKKDSLKNFKAFGTYVKKNVEGYLDKLSTAEGIKEEALGSSGLSGVGGIAATFIGKGAKGYDEAADRLAQELYEQGVDPREIWKQTGVRRWLSGNRQEISDAAMKPNFTTFKDPKLKHWNETKRGYKPIDYDTALDLYTKDQGKNVVSTTNLGDLIQHDELFSNYPELKKTRVQIDPLYKAKTAAYSLDDNTIYISPEDFYKGDMSALLHEIQHNVQDIEKWQSGGSPKDFKAYESLMPRVSDKGDINFYNPFELYRRLPGEIEARNTQTRQFMTDAERRASFPDYTAKEIPFSEMKIHKRKYGVKK